ncbi:hypothetical protein ACQ4LE_000772 [Meloidogyne hapla]
MKNKNFFPIELLSEIVNFVPFNLKWSKILVSKIFDLLIINRLKRWIIRLKFYKREVVLSLEQIVAIFTGTTNDFISKKKYIKLLDRIEDFYVDVSEWASSSPNLNIPTIYNWPVADAWRRRSELKLCYDERKEELRSLFERLLAFFRLKGINELNFLAWRLAFKGKLRQASKLMDFETSVIRR